MKSLADLLRNSNLNSPILKGVRASIIVEAGEAVLVNLFGPEIKVHANVAFFKNNTLTIACLSGSVASEIKLNEPRILAQINAKVPGANVTKIRYLS